MIEQTIGNTPNNNISHPQHSPNQSALLMQAKLQNAGPILQQMRTTEIAQIKSYLIECLTGPSRVNTRQARICFIMGAPGTGKTSSVKLVLGSLGSFLPNRKIKIISINTSYCDKVKEILSTIQCQIGREESWEQIHNLEGNMGKKERQHKHITKSKIIKKQKKQQRENGKKNQINTNDELSEGKSNRNDQPLCIVYVEEIDLLPRNNSPEQIQKFMDLFNYHQKSKIMYTLVGVTNDMLLEQTFAKKLWNFSARPEIKTIIYNLYSTEQMVAMMKDKLNAAGESLGIQLQVEERLLKFAAAKIEQNKKGDMRFSIQFIKMLLKETKKQLLEKQKNQEQIKQYVITAEKIKNALSPFRDTKVSIIEQLSFNQQIILTLIYTYVKKTQAIMIPYSEIVKETRKAYEQLKLNFNQEYLSGIKELESYGVIMIRKKGQRFNDLSSNIILKAGMDQIEEGLSHNEVLSKYYL